MWSYISIGGGWYDSAGKWQDTIVLNTGQKIKLTPHPGMKVVHTHHGMPNASLPPPRVKFPRFVGISNAHAQLLGSILKMPVRMVHNGIKLPEWLPEKYDDRGYLLSLNRITDEKGIHDSIDIAMQHDLPIKVIGDDTHVRSQEYVMNIIERCRSSRGLAEYYGLVDNETKEEALKHCKAVIACPVNQGPFGWTEAFGLYAAEGMSYGKTFIGLANGGLLDIIEHGVSGYLGLTPTSVSSFMPEIIKGTISPETVRKRIEDKFTVTHMVNNYMDLFTNVLDDSKESGRW
jgi:glycosyltransferase involved in cell wall biosynthesis